MAGACAEGLRAPNPASPRRKTRGEWVSAAETPSKAAGPREPGAASPALPYGEVGRGRKRLALLSGSEALCGCGLLPRSVSLCRMQLPEARLGPVRRGLGAVRPSWLRGHGWAGAEAFAPNPASHEGEPVGSGFPPETPAKQQGPGSQGSQPALPYGERGKAFARPILLPHEGEPVGSGFGRRRPPAKQQGPGSQGQPPALPYGERGAGAKNGLSCFLDPRRVGAVVCCPRRVSLCRMQLPEARFGRSV
uniref:Uncharacterized protein n=1 Tax=Sus scrofa TaxID=9823 RepID=A0A4X1TDI3_PIG